MKRWIAMLLCAALLLGTVGCTGSNETTPTGDERQPGAEAVIGAEYHTDFVCQDNNRVFYEIFVGSFSDSDGDGVGDLRGIINRMDYLNDGDPNSGLSLGVEGLWLTPIFTSPSYHKYDVTDYYEIDPEFGTMDDLRELVQLCHERNVEVILDLVINHTSTQCAWFKEFSNAHKNGDTESEYYDFYTWCTKDDKPSGRTFNAISGTDHLYECNFWDQMPELNYDNPAVRQAVLDVAKFYLELGVDGFRFDAAKYIYFGDHAASVEFWNWYMDELRAIKPDVYTVAEVWDSDSVIDLYYPALNCFNFSASLNSGLIAETAKHGDVNRYVAYVESCLNKIEGLRSDSMLLLFITNHDMDRAAGFLNVASYNMQVAANLYLLGPGSPFIYYGEELGMCGSRGSANTDSNRRLAMLWGDGDTVSDPVGATYPATSQVSDTVVDQLANEGSLLSYYKALLRIRSANPEIARGEYHALSFSGTKLGGFTSTWEGNTVCVIHNTTLNPITVDLSTVTSISFTTLAAVIGKNDATLDGTTLTVGGQTSVVLR